MKMLPILVLMVRATCCGTPAARGLAHQLPAMLRCYSCRCGLHRSRQAKAAQQRARQRRRRLPATRGLAAGSRST